MTGLYPSIPRFNAWRGHDRVIDHHTHAMRQVLRLHGMQAEANYTRCDYASDTMVGFIMELSSTLRTCRRVYQADVPRAGYSDMPDYELAAAMLLVQL